MKKMMPMRQSSPKSDIIDRICNGLKVQHQGLREAMAEFMGTLMLVVFITGALMQHKLSRDPTTAGLDLAGGVGVMMAFFMCGQVSAGCFNPSISLAVCLYGLKPWKVLPWHVIGQILGAFTAAALVHSVYTEALDDFDGGERSLIGANGTGMIFCSFPKPYLSNKEAFADSVLASWLLVIGAISITHKQSLNPPSWFYAISLGLLVTGITSGFGFNAGANINPAKDLGPRLFIFIAGWGNEAFSYRDYNWFWIPVVAPLAGSITACFVYWLLIGNHFPDEICDGNNTNTQRTEDSDRHITPGSDLIHCHRRKSQTDFGPQHLEKISKINEAFTIS